MSLTRSVNVPSTTTPLLDIADVQDGLAREELHLGKGLLAVLALHGTCGDALLQRRLHALVEIELLTSLSPMEACLATFCIRVSTVSDP